MLAVAGLSQALGVEPSQAGSLIQQQLGSCLRCPIVSLFLSDWYSGSGVLLDCIDS